MSAPYLSFDLDAVVRRMPGNIGMLARQQVLQGEVFD